jgi:tetratricopeptide (TPR) repeat protein
MFEEGNPEEQMLEQAKESLRLGDRARAKDLLTRLLKIDQNNATYWVWMSAAMDTQKERIYCLQTALKLDPNNTAARRGLVMHGALPPDDSIPPFPLNHPRPWEANVTVAGEEDRPRGFRAFWANPFARLGMIILIGILLLAITVFAFNRAQRLIPAPTRTPGPSPTFTITVTLLPTPTPFVRTATPTFVGPTPLALMLESTYTPTPLYVDTPHPAVEAYRAGIRYFNVHDYPNAQLMMDQVIFIEPNAADAYYYKGLSAIAQQDYENAINYFRTGTEMDAGFAPNYVGFATARLEQGTTGRVLDDLERAIDLDPDFLDSYLVRARYYLLTEDPESALADAGTAIALAPESPFGYLYLAEAQLALDNPAGALKAAITASALDFTNLDAYRLLGRAYTADDQPEKAVGPLQTYTLYRADDPEAFMLLGDAYYAAEDFENAVTTYTKALALDEELGEAYAKRGRAYLALGEADKAIDDLDSARLYLPNTLAANLVVAQAYILKEEPNNAYALLLRVERLVDSDSDRAEYLYWRALSLEGMAELEAAANDWETLLALPTEAVPAAMRLEAEQRLAQIHTPTPTRTPTVTRTPTRTPRPSATP